jgi:hypothetical protein
MQSASRLSDAEPQRSPERQKLAAAIEHLGALNRQLGRLAESRGRLGLRDKERVLDSARRALDEVQQRAPATIVARALGEPYDPAATVEHAQQLLDAAQYDLAEAVTADRLLADETRGIEDRREVAYLARERAVAEVLRVSPEIAAVCARVSELREQLAAMSWVCSAISRGLPPGAWDGILYGPDCGHGAPWKAAITALEQDADAALPG